MALYLDGQKIISGRSGETAVVLYGTTAPTSSQGSDGDLYVQYTVGTGGADDIVDALFVKLGGEWCEIETGGGSSATVRFDINASHIVNPTKYDIVVSVGETEVYSHSYSCSIYGVFSETTDTFVYDNESYTITAQGYQANQGQKMLDVSINGTEESVYCSATNSSYPCNDDFFITVSEDLGGHTILDNSGTALEQRPNLQFNGAYSEDNSTDDTTEVNVVREMTKAEFDELTEEEKTGFINITDITGGNDDRFQPVIYSEEEREIGVWTDGKPLYEKTYHNSAITIASDTELTIDDFSDKFPVSCNGVMRNSTDNRTYYPNYSYAGAEQANIYYKKDGIGNFVLRSESDSWGNTWEVFTVVRYTKDSDAAGSGQWTPQGVPAHHYSEDEQVVGTWIDGSTIYEKTYDLSSNPITIVRSWVTVATDPTVSQIVNAIGLCGVICENAIEVRVNNSDIQIERVGVNEADTRTLTYLTIQYTKTST